MDFVFLFSGIAIMVIVITDILWTTMGEGGGFLTKYFSAYLFKATFILKRKTGSNRLVAISGIAIIILIILTWIFLLWGAWLLIFLFNSDSIVDTNTLQVSDFWDKVYFVGFTIFTLGTGDFKPNGNLWQALTPFATLTGWFTVTFSITYLIPIVQAFTNKRSAGLLLYHLGKNPQQIIINGWENGNLNNLYNKFPTISSHLAEIDQEHKTYPVLHYLHALNKREALAVGIVRLDEALTIIEFGMDKIYYTKEIRYLRNIIYEFMNTLKDTFVEKSPDIPPPPSLKELEEFNIPVIDEKQFKQNIEKINNHRKHLKEVLINERWEWKDIEKDYSAERK
jgi:hypothetical protein